eukprot:gene562-707_t
MFERLKKENIVDKKLVYETLRSEFNLKDYAPKKIRPPIPMFEPVN